MATRRHVAAIVLGLLAVTVAATGGSLEVFEVAFGASLVGGAGGVVLGLAALLLAARGSRVHSDEPAHLARARKLGRRSGIAGFILGLGGLVLFAWTALRLGLGFL